MKIFLSHRSRDKPLVNDFKELLPPFLSTWLDDESLAWGDSLAATLKTTIQSGVDFLIIFLDADSLDSAWVREELQWALARERDLKRTFVLPVLLPGAALEKLPQELRDRLGLRLPDYARGSIEALANRATEKLFQLVVTSYSAIQLQAPQRRQLMAIRDELSAGQAKLLGYLEKQGADGAEMDQRGIEQALSFSHASAELYYRLEALVQHGFITKRRIATDGMFSYRLTDEFRAELGKR